MDAAFTIGRHRVYRLEEWQGGFSSPEALFAEYEEAAFNQQAGDFEPTFFRDGLIYGYLQSWLIDTGSERIIVDTGVGNDKDRPGIPIFGQLATPFLDGLAAAGFGPGDIDKVFCTHLHSTMSGGTSNGAKEAGNRPFRRRATISRVPTKRRGTR